MDDAAPTKKSVWTTLRILVLLVLLTAAFAGYARYFANQRAGRQQVYDNLEVLDTRLQNIENSILLHEKRIKDLEDTTQKLATGPVSASTIAAASSAPITVTPTVAPTAATPAPDTTATPAPASAATGSDDRVASLEKEIATLKTALPQQDNEKVYQSIRLLSAFHRLSDKVIGGKPFATELSAFEALSAPDESAGSPLATLAPYAESGIPTFATLLVTFDQSVEGLNTTEAIPPAGASVYQRFMYNIKHLVSIRRIDDAQQGNAADAIVGRAQAHLEHEEIEAAVAEIKSLPDASRGNFAAWLDDAQMVTEAPSLVDQIEEQVIQKAFHATPPAATPPAASAPVPSVPAPAKPDTDNSATTPKSE